MEESVFKNVLEVLIEECDFSSLVLGVLMDDWDIGISKCGFNNLES